MTPIVSSSTTIIGMRIFAFTGIGGMINISLALGKINANAIRIPNIAPEAPTNGTISFIWVEIGQPAFHPK